MAFPQIGTPSGGPLTAADLDAARKHSTGHIHLVPAGCGQYRWPERRVNWPDTEPTDDRTQGWLDSCAPEGGAHHDPAPAFESMLRHRRNLASIKAGFCLALMLVVVGYVVRAVYPL